MKIDWPAVYRDYETLADYHHCLSESLYSLGAVLEANLGEYDEEYKDVTALYMSLLGKIALRYVDQDEPELTVVKKI